jgi:methylphosphotriester-DNA--protein-cysteine methyltransferase
MIAHNDLSVKELFSLIHKKDVVLAGNKRLKIYGLLRCSSGKRMKKENRVFFASEEEALQAGYRACLRCFRNQRYDWQEAG